MKTFRSLFDEKMCDPAFQSLYQQECHVCAHTMGIFQKAIEMGLSNEQLASDLAVDPEKIRRLADADHCDPPLVVRLCRRLDLPVPKDCPRMTGRK